MRTISIWPRAVLALALFYASVGCATRLSRPIDPTTGVLETYFENQPGNRAALPLDTRNASRISEVGLERGRCYGRCPRYTVLFRADGSAEYVGRGNVARVGRYFARIEAARFAMIAAYVEDVAFFTEEMALSYSGRVVGETDIDLRGGRLPQPTAIVEHTTDLPSSFISVVRAGVRKTVRDYGGAGPPRLQVLGDLLDRELASLKWRRAQEPANKPLQPPSGTAGKGSSERP